MLRLVIRRLGEMVIVLLVLTAVVFILRQLQPADAARVALGGHASVGAVEDYRRSLGFDQPLYKQYVIYIGDVIHGDFQISVRTRRPVSQDLAQALPATLELASVALLAALVGGLLFGVLGVAGKRGSSVIRGIMLFGASIPVFLFAYGCILIFARKLGWLPIAGRTSYRDFHGPTGFLTVDSLLGGRLDVFFDACRHLVLPAITIAILSAVSIGRVLRSSLTTTLNS